jgi:hypothetical protein
VIIEEKSRHGSYQCGPRDFEPSSTPAAGLMSGAGATKRSGRVRVFPRVRVLPSGVRLVRARWTGVERGNAEGEERSSNEGWR